MARKIRDKNNPNSGVKSTKDLKGKRINGVLYLKKGVGTGCFSGVGESNNLLQK